jgi:hypothetical protein
VILLCSVSAPLVKIVPPQDVHRLLMLSAGMIMCLDLGTVSSVTFCKTLDFILLYYFYYCTVCPQSVFGVFLNFGAQRNWASHMPFCSRLQGNSGSILLTWVDLDVGSLGSMDNVQTKFELLSCSVEHVRWNIRILDWCSEQIAIDITPQEKIQWCYVWWTWRPRHWTVCRSMFLEMFCLGTRLPMDPNEVEH